MIAAGAQLKNLAEFLEGVEFDEVLSGRRGIYRCVLEYPRVFVEEEDSVQSGRKRRIDVASGAVADHPACMRRELVARNDFVIGRGIFLRNDFDSGEVRRERGARQLVSLLGAVAFGHEDEAMARGQFGQRLSNAGKKLNLLLGNSASETENFLGLFRGDGLGTEALEAGH